MPHVPKTYHMDSINLDDVIGREITVSTIAGEVKGVLRSVVNRSEKSAGYRSTSTHVHLEVED